MAAALIIDKSLKKDVFRWLEHLREIGVDWKGMIIYWLIGIAIVLVNFPMMLYEIFLGSIIREYWKGVLIAFGYKVVGGLTGFTLSRVLLKGTVKEQLKTNKIF